MSNPIHVLVKQGQEIPAEVVRRTRAAAITYTQQGTTTHFRVSFDASLNTPTANNGTNMANAVLGACEGYFSLMQRLFGGVTPGSLPFDVFIDSGSFGAFHGSCGDTTIHSAAFGATNGDLVNFVTLAEVAEVFMAAQGRGWDCGASAGEGLSRVLATEGFPAQLNGFASAASWLDGGRPDWVTRSEGTDRNFVSIGCAVLFINYLRSLGFTIDQITQAGGSTVQNTHIALTGSSDALDPFTWQLQKRFPFGTPSGLTGDNPFPIADPSSPRPMNVLVHLQDIGDVSGLRAFQFAGTRGQSRRLEGFQLSFNPAIPGLSMEYMAHLQDIGDVPWVGEGHFVGTRGQSRRLEGFAVRLTGPQAPNFYVTYMAHLQDIGDVPWVKDGAFCGTRGQSRRLEGLSVKVAPKVFDVLVHLQDIGDTHFYGDELAGTRGQSRRLEGFQINFTPAIANLGLSYMAHLQDIGDTPWVNDGQFIGTRGQSRRLEGFAIKPTGSNTSFDIWYMAHLEGIGDTRWFKNGEFCGTRGESRRVEAIRVKLASR